MATNTFDFNSEKVNLMKTIRADDSELRKLEF